MAATNIFYRIPSQRGIKIATLTGSECTLHQFCNYIIDSEGLNRNDFIIASGTKVFRPNSCNLQSISLQNNSHVDILIPLLGGKGGFGSLLRAIGAQIEKTTNRDACRDLSGRRLRDIKREEELKKLLALQEKLIEEKERRKQEKLDKLRKKTEASETCTSIQELVAMFDDQNYNKRRLEISDILNVAVDKGIINFQKTRKGKKVKGARHSATTKVDDANTCTGQSETSSDSGEDSIVCDKHPQESRNRNLSKKKDLWLGLEEEFV